MAAGMIKTYTALMATVVFWGLSFVATKVALESIPTFTLVFVRFFLAALIFLFLRQGRKWPIFQGKDKVKMALLAIFEPGALLSLRDHRTPIHQRGEDLVDHRHHSLGCLASEHGGIRREKPVAFASSAFSSLSSASSC